MKASSQPLELAIAVKGEIVSSNFDAFQAYAESQIEAISFELVTDEDFEQAADDVKGLKKFEDSLASAKADFLAQMDDVNQLLQKVDALCALSRSTRLELEKLVKQQKEAVKLGIIRDGIAALEASCSEFTHAITEAVKGKSSLVRMHESVSQVVTEINQRIATNRQAYEKAADEYGASVAYGEADFLCLSNTVAIIELERRVERHKASIKEAELKAEAEKLRKEKAERDAAEAERVVESVTANQLWVKTEVGPPAPVPAAQPVTPVEALAPAPNEDQTEQEEMEIFLQTLKSAFAPIKAAKAQLKHRANIERAMQFAETLSAAWTKLNEEGGE